MNGPYQLKGKGRSLFLVHGFTATAFESYGLAHHLNQTLNYSATGILLKGHGTTLKDLSNTRAKQWMEQTKSELQKKVEISGPQDFIGFSMGANLGLLLHEHDPHWFRSLCFIAPTLWAKKRSARLLLFALGLYPFKLPFKTVAKTSKAFVPNVSYRHFPLSSLKEANHIFHHARKAKPITDIPCAVFYASNDQTSHPKSAKNIIEKSKHPLSYHKEIANAPHTLSLSPQKEILFKEVENFYKTLDPQNNQTLPTKNSG